MVNFVGGHQNEAHGYSTREEAICDIFMPTISYLW